jgi:hypothetical protein
LHPWSNRNVRNLTSMQYISKVFKIASLSFTQNIMHLPYSLKAMSKYLWTTRLVTIVDYHVLVCRIFSLFSSPELKAQVSFSDHRLSVVRLSVYPSVNFYIFDFFSRTTGPILTRLGTNHPWGRGIKFVQMKEITLLQGEIIAKE